jgi:hypothetical protein
MQDLTMHFPSYVPNAVRDRITQWLEGIQRQLPAYLRDGLRDGTWCITWIRKDKKWLAFQKGLRSQISTAREELAGANSLESRRQLNSVLESLEADQNALHQLASDPRMQQAYADLNNHDFIHDRQWHIFIDSAVEAQRDFGLWRDRLKRAQPLRKQIAKAKQVILALKEVGELEIVAPEIIQSRSWTNLAKHRSSRCRELDAAGAWSGSRGNAK